MGDDPQPTRAERADEHTVHSHGTNEPRGVRSVVLKIKDNYVGFYRQHAFDPLVGGEASGERSRQQMIVSEAVDMMLQRIEAQRWLRFFGQGCKWIAARAI
jgi:glutamine phosphoribosylpyrophosphate amidotransferase